LEQVVAENFKWTDLLKDMLEIQKCGDCMFHMYVPHVHVWRIALFVSSLSLEKRYTQERMEAMQHDA
jgi:hypothetical protein